MVNMNRRSIGIAMLAYLLIVWIGTYTAAYVGTQIKSAAGTNGPGRFIVHYYSADWQVVAFQPAAAIESAIRRHEVQVAYEFRP